MSVVGGVMDFESVYRKDFGAKIVEGPLREPNPLDHNCMIRASFIDNLRPNLEINPKEPREHFCLDEKEYYENSIQKLTNKEEAVGKKYFNQPLDVKPVVMKIEDRPKSSYMLDYCKRGFLYSRSVVDKKDFGIKLSDDHKVPDTTTGYYFRDPISIALKGIERTKSMRPYIDNTLKKKTVEILDTKCGFTTYDMCHSLLGQAILENKPYGKSKESPMCNRWGEPLEGHYVHRIR